MANFNYLDFFKIPSANDTKLFIKDINNNIVWSLSPFKINSSILNNNNIRINFTNGDFVLIDFNNVYESKIALTNLQNAINILINKPPISIDKDVELYINNLGLTNSNSSSFSNLIAYNPEGQTYSVVNNANSFTFLTGASSTSNISTLQSYDNSQGIYLETIIPGPTSSSNIVLGVFGLIYSYYISINDTGSLISNYSIYDYYGNDIYDGTYSQSFLFSIYLDGYNVYYGINGNNICSSTYSIDSYYYLSYPVTTLTTNYTFTNVEYYPTGKRGYADKYFCTTNTYITIPSVYGVVTLQTQPNLSYTSGQWVLVSNDRDNFYTIGDYDEDDSILPKFYGQIDDYNPISGSMSVVCLQSNYIGGTGSFWYINLSGASLEGFVEENGVYTLGGDLIIEGTTKFQQTEEILNTSTASTSIIYDYNLGSIWYHNDLTSNYSANFINIPTDNNTAITSTIIISQSGTAYIPSSIYINGTQQVVKWGNGVYPSGNINQTDIIGLTFITYNNSIVEVLGQLSTYSPGALPTVTTDSISSGEPCVATGTVNNIGGSPITEMGFVYATHDTPTISDSRVTASNPGIGTFTVDINVSPYPESYGRAYAINNAGVAYGSQVSFSGPCFAKGTLVTLSDGSSKKIEDITFNDSLLVWNFDEGKFDFANPVWIMKPITTSDTFTCKFSDGSELTTAGKLGIRKTSHRIFNIEKGKFTYLVSDEDTPIGTHTFNDKDEIVTLISKEPNKVLTEIYNIVTFKHLNMFCNSLLTSIRLNNIYPINNMKFVKDNRQIIPFNKFKGITEEYYNGFRLGEQPLVEISENFAETNTTPTLEELINHMQTYYK